MTITEKIRELVADWIHRGHTPDARGINSGNCDSFAGDLEDAGYGTLMWGEELDTEDWSKQVQNISGWVEHNAYRHCFVKFEGRYYDSECLMGAEYPDGLPLYRRCLSDYPFFIFHLPEPVQIKIESDLLLGEL